MIITLFRSTDFPSHFRDMGEHDFAYSFLPHEGSISSAHVAEEGCLFNSPLTVIPGEAEVTSPEKANTDGMIIDCIKPAEDGNGIIVRMYEPYGTSGKTKVILSKESAVTETSPLEEAIGEAAVCTEFEVSYKPYEIRTFRIV